MVKNTKLMLLKSIEKLTVVVFRLVSAHKIKRIKKIKDLVKNMYRLKKNMALASRNFPFAAGSQSHTFLLSKEKKKRSRI